MSRKVLFVLGGLLAAGFAMTSATSADAAKACYNSSGTAGWFLEKSAADSSVRRLNRAIDAEARKKKWKVVYVTPTKTSCSKSAAGWYKCTSTASACSSK